MRFSPSRKATQMNDNVTSGQTLEQKRLALLRKRRGIGNAEAGAETGIPIMAESDTVLASFAQQRLWFLDRLAPGNPFYTVSLKLPLDGVIHPDKLEQALAEIARRHSALRTTFAEKDGQPIQVIHKHPIFPMERIDLSTQPRAIVEARLEAIDHEETFRSFDLTKGPLAVARLVTVAPRRHYLLLTLHHIVCDGWSLKVLGRELTEIYSALIQGHKHSLPELAVQYRDFSAWQRQMLEGSRMAAHRAYWTGKLADAPELAIPTDFQRPSQPTYGGAFVPFSLDRDIAEQIRRLSAEEGYTPFMVLLTVWMVLLGRHADMDDILVAAPSAGRNRRELEAMIGFFVNTLVLRGDLSGDPDFRACIDRVRHTCLEAFSHDDYPFDRLVEDLAPKRRGDRNPLAQVVFQLFSAPDRSLGHAAPEERQRGTSKFDLRLDLWDTEEGYSGELEYSTDLFEHETAVLMAEQFQVLLQSLLAQPDQPISEASLMSQHEFDWLTTSCNQTDRPLPDSPDIIGCFAQSVAAHGDKPAVAWGEHRLTYQELDSLSDGLACELADAGVGRGDHVAVLLPRSPEMIVAWLGILKTGAAYVPFDADTPAARLRGMLETVHVAALISDADNAGLPGPTGAVTILVDMARWQDASRWTPVRAEADAVANIMFTSGSTGKPKAVLVPQQGIIRLAIGQEFWTVKPGDRIAQGSNCAFDAATLEVWTALLNGCCLVGLDRNDLLSPDRLHQRIANGDFQHLFLTTALFHRLAEEDPGIFAGLTSLVFGGSRIEPENLRRVLDAGRPKRIVNAYGPTETTTLGTVWPIEQFDLPLANVPIGFPINNGTAYILDQLGRLVPRTVPGELFLGGPGVALGYLDDPEQTARKFGPSPFREGERLYATGDRARLRHDGSVDYLGRFDDQKKIRGFRVEPDEIASALRSHPRVADAEVLITEVRGDGAASENRIVAFYVPVSEGDTDTRSLESEDEAVAYWQRIYEDVVYQDVGKRSDADARFDTTGWTDSATGDLLADADMAEQIKQTCDRVVALGGHDILEFGCGTGLIIFPLVPQVASIHGIDISQRALDHIERTAKANGIDKITLQQGSAEVLDGIADDSFDTVILNSTVQYFPSADYLKSLLRNLLRVTRPGGAIFLGDIRHKGLIRAFQAEIAANRSDESTTARAVAHVVERRVEEEQELLLDPNWFLRLRSEFPQLGDISIQLKRGAGHNELARFRYDVVLHLGKASKPPKVREIRWGDDVFSLDDVMQVARQNGKAALMVRGIPNTRTAFAQATAELLQEADAQIRIGALTRRSRAAWPDAISPETAWKTFEEQGFAVQIGWGEDLACFDLVVSASPPLPPLALAGATPEPGAQLANFPALGRSLRGLETELSAYLEKLLPDYMVPQGFVRLNDMPLTQNGKLDKKTLAASLVSTSNAPTRPPQTDVERQLAAIFCSVLQVPHVGLDDDFFRLGGHSLKATQVISRIATEFGVSIPLRTVFEAGTVDGLARAIEAARAKSAPGHSAAAVIAAQGELDIDAMDPEALERALASLEDETEGAGR